MVVCCACQEDGGVFFSPVQNKHLESRLLGGTSRRCEHARWLSVRVRGVGADVLLVP